MKFLFFLCIIVDSLCAQDTVVYTLQKCIDMALQNNLTTIMSANDMESAKAYMHQSRAGLMPSINAYANQGMSNGKSINPYTNAFINQEVNTGQYGLNGSLNLFSGFANINTISQNTNGHKAAKLDVEQTRINVLLLVVEAYLQICCNEELYKQALQQQEVTLLQLSRLKTMEQNNAISPSILYDIKGQLANDKLSLINSKTALLAAKLNLAQLLNINFTSNCKFLKSESTPIEVNSTSIDNLINEAVNNSPSIKSAHYKSKSALKNLHSAYGQLFPSLSLNSNLGSNYSSAAFAQKITDVQDVATGAYVNIAGTKSSVIAPEIVFQSEKISFMRQVNNNLNTYIGLSLQMPLFNGLKNRTQIKLAQLNYKYRITLEQNALVKFKNQIEQTTNDLQNAKEKYFILLEQVADYTESLRIATSKFDKGALTTLEYISIKTNLSKSKANLVLAYYDCVLKQKTIDVLVRGEVIF